MLDKLQLDGLRQLIQSSNKIVVTTHNNPDGDAIGSALAMMHYLKSKKHDVTVVIPNIYPEFLAWMPGTGDIMVYEREAKKIQKKFDDSDLIFCLDYNALNRFGAATDILKKCNSKRVLIDHHIDPEVESFEYCYSTTDTSSTGELIFDFIELMGDKHLIDKVIAECLYTCIITDTGSFSYAANNEKTYRIAAELIGLGVDGELIHRLIYDTFSENRLRLLGHALNKRLIVWDELHTALIYLTKDDLRQYQYQVGDTEGVVNFPLMMDKVNLSILITEKDNTIRLSFRSKGEFSVNNLARKYFNGGGHRNAAGGRTNETIDITINQIKTVLQEFKSSLDYTLSY